MKRYWMYVGLSIVLAAVLFWRIRGRTFDVSQSVTYEAEVGGYKHSDRLRIRHVFLITIDTLRADHLGCYGYPRNTSGFIDFLAENGVVFNRAYSQSASTGPSHASIFTGLYPYQHKVICNYYLLDDSYVTLAERLCANGIITSAFTSVDKLFSPSKIDQGFAVHGEPPDTIKTYGFKYRPAEYTIDEAVAWLDISDPSEKTFTWVHLFDPHFPYNPPEKYLSEIDSGMNKETFLEYLAQLYIDDETFAQKTLDEEYENLCSSEKMYDYISNYDAEIAYADSELQRFYDFAGKKGFAEDSLWIITGDHGEGLGQHSWLGHAFMIYQEEIHVPLIFFSDKNLQPARIDHVVENFDIFSTVLELFGVKPDEKAATEIKSVSLLKQVLGEQESPGKEYAFCEREGHVAGNKLIVRWGDKEKMCIQNRNFKYIYRSDNQDEFYSLKEDPFEQINLVGSSQSKYTKEMKALKEKLSRIIDDKEKYDRLRIKAVDEDSMEKLKSLGYVQ